MIEWKEAKILHHHWEGGCCASTSTYVKENNLYLLSGCECIAMPSKYFPDTMTGKEMKFKRGWYNDKLEFVSEVTEEDLNEMNECLLF